MSMAIDDESAKRERPVALPEKADDLPMTGERYVPGMGGEIELEHLHRYAVAAQLVSGKRVLDLASGEGYGAAALAEKAVAVVGVDIDPVAVAHAQSRYGTDNLSYRVGSCSAIPLDAESVDIVTSFETIEHVEDHEAMLRELSRVLTHDGILVISSPNRQVYSDQRGGANPYHVKELYLQQFEALLRSHFSEVTLYGQSVLSGSVIRQLDSSQRPLTGFEVGRPADERTSGGKWVYFLAVCSKQATTALQAVESSYIRHDTRPYDELQHYIHYLTSGSEAPEHLRPSPRPVVVRFEPFGMVVDDAECYRRTDGKTHGFVGPDQQAWMLTGWAVDAETMAPAAEVLISDGFHGVLCRPCLPRRDVAAHLNNLAAWWSGFALDLRDFDHLDRTRLQGYALTRNGNYGNLYSLGL